MINEVIIIAAVAVGVITLIYQAIPCRELPGVRPGFALLPKYRTAIDWSSPSPDPNTIEQMFAECGFRPVRSDDHAMHFQRGKLLGDFSVKVLRLKCTISIPENSSSALTVKAGWMIAFDTGDLWTFTSQLKEKLQSHAIQASPQHP